MEYRTGLGYDIHRLVKGRPLFLGGVKLPHPKGLLGHSDADVLLHAVCDALLGALGLGDIGEHFPDTELRFKDISSAELLKKVVSLVKKNKGAIVSVDAVVVLQEPKLLLFKKQIRRRLSGILKVDESRVSVKAKTNEGLGETGKEKAIASYAVATVKKR